MNYIGLISEVSYCFGANDDYFGTKIGQFHMKLYSGKIREENVMYDDLYYFFSFNI